MVLISVVKIIFVIAVVFSAVPILVYLERRISAGIQGRIGPNRVGPLGLLQPLADAIKLVFKEDIIPTNVDRFLYMSAPILTFLPPALALAVIPFGNRIGNINLQIANLNIGVLFILAITSGSVYGIAFGGWASSNKYSLLGGLRSSAQMISYEITLGLSAVAIIMTAGSVSMSEIVLYQNGSILNWYAFKQPVAFVLFCIAALAENNRLPFDLPECEAELVGGYHTEYSSMKFSMFFLGEYVAMISMSALGTALFLGGWNFPGITNPHDSSILGGIISMLVFGAKVGVILFIYIWIRWTLPRFKWQQLMHIGWKILIPVSLLNIVVTSAIIIFRRAP